ncbi:unknown [[Mannheimia] succiniciproducens MBEL55E]|uniref:Uncharacterized protein n=1 Tax=Mannheimia succiniciproducens (strain KCTC 0769BP / MBEL55E) TaxID=221988 RepID=Q65SG8_MANSM|nr:unknown [[Mannheimia] succiniciproducens MBEL55E]
MIKMPFEKIQTAFKIKRIRSGNNRPCLRLEV